LSSSNMKYQQLLRELDRQGDTGGVNDSYESPDP